MIAGGNERAVRAWCLYDWGNSAFATVCMTGVLPAYLASLANTELGAPAGSVMWGWTAAAGLAVGAVLAPPLGALADSRGIRRKLLAAFAALGVAATAALAIALPGSWRLAALLYVVAATGFTGANVFYDGLLPGLAPASRWDAISAKGYAWGYAGGGIALVGAAGLALALPGSGVRWAFLLTAAWWAAFTWPVVTRVAEPPVEGSAGAFRRLAQTLREARGHPVMWRFLVAYWLYNDGIGTIIKLAGAYGTEVGVPMATLLGALVLAQAVGVPATVGFGRLAKRIGTKRAIELALLGYVAVVAFAYVMVRPWHFVVLACLVGLVQGGAQALSRSLFARLVPRGREAEYFSFLDVSGRMAGIAGPVMFSLLTSAAGSGRTGILAVLALFAAGGWMLHRLPLPDALTRS